VSTQVRESASPEPGPPIMDGTTEPVAGAPTELDLEPELTAPYVPIDATFDRIAQMAANVFEAPVATVAILGKDRVWYPTAQGLEGQTVPPVGAGLVASIQQQSAPFVVDEAATDPRTMDHPLVRGPRAMRFYVAAPIMSPDQQVWGSLEVLDRRRRRRVSDTQLSLLGNLAATVAQLIQIRRSALVALREERALRAAEIDRRDVAERLVAQQHTGEDGTEQTRSDWCQLGGSQACPERSELKVVDSWGDSAWGCWAHAEEALMMVPSVFLASESPVGLATYRRRP
jgi:GAF domain-containing protein